VKPYPLVDDLLLRPYPKVRHRQYRTLLLPSPDPRLDARDPRWSSQRAVGSAAFLTRYLPPTRETKKHPRASTNSSTWRLKGVRYLFKVPYARSNFCSGRAESTGAEERDARLAAAIMSDSPRPVMPEGPKSRGRHGSVCRIDGELGRAWHDSGRGKCGLGLADYRHHIVN
jgi:hypothetical protein